MRTSVIYQVLVVMIFASSAWAQNRYWVGGSGTWHDPAHWSTTSGGAGGASVPNSANDVFFNAQSFSANGQYVANLSTDLEMYCKSITFANLDDNIDFNFTTGTPGGVYTQARLIVSQNLTLSDKVSFDFDDGRIELAGSANRQVTFNNAIVGYLDIKVDEAVNVLVQDDVLTDHGIFMSGGNLIMNGDLKGDFVSLIPHDTSSIDIFMGTHKIQCGWLNAVKYLAAPNTVVLHFTTGNIECERISPGRYIDYPRVVINTTIPYSSTGTPGVDYNNNATWSNDNIDVTFQSLEFVTGELFQILGNPEILDSIVVVSGADIKLSVGDTLFCPKWHYIPSGCGGGSFTLRSATNGSQAKIKNTGTDTLFLFNATIKDMVGLGAPVKVVNGVNSGNTTNILFGTGSTPDVFYWIGNGGSWTDVNHWSFSSGGPVAGCLPDINDVVMFDAASFTLTGQVVEIPQGVNSVRDMIWSQPLDTVLIRFVGTTTSSILKIYGSLTLASKVKVGRTGNMEWNFAATTNANLDTKNVDLLNVAFEGTAQFTLQSNFKVYDVFDVNYGDITLKQGSLLSNGYNIKCRSFFITTGGSKTFSLGANDTLSTFSFAAVDAFSFPYATHCIIARDFKLDFATANTIVVHKLILTENDILNVSSLTLRKRPQFHYLSIDYGGMVRVEGDFTILSDLAFLHRSGGIQFDDFPVAPTGADTIVIGGNIVYPTGACSANYCINTQGIDQIVYFTKPSGNLVFQNTLLRNARTLPTGAIYTAQNCVLAGASQGWTVTAPTASTTYFWRGGNGDWDDASHWSLTSGGPANPSGCIPGIADRVVFDNNSNTAFNPVNVDFPVYMQPVVADVFINANNKAINFLNIVGSKVFVTDTLWFTSKATSNIFFDMTGLNSAKLINPETSLSSLMDVAVSKYNAAVVLDRKLNVDNITIQSGEFQTMNYDLSAKFISISPSSNTLTVNFGTSSVSTNQFVVGNANAIIAATAYKLYVTSYISCLSVRSFPWVQVNNTAALTLNNFAYDLSFGTLRLMSTFDVTLMDADFTITDSLHLGVPGAKLNVSPAATLNIQGQLFSAGISGNLCFLRSTMAGSRFDLSHEKNICVSYLNLKDVEDLGPGIFNVLNGVNGGNNAGIDFATPVDMGKLYWRGGSGLWNVASNWSFKSGSCPASRIPTAADDVYFDQHADLDSYTEVTMPANASCKNLFFSGYQDTVALDIGSTFSVSSCEIDQAKAVLKNGIYIDKTHLVVNNGTLGLVSTTTGVNQYPSLADSIGFKVGPGSVLQMINSNMLVMGNKNVFGFPSLYLDPTASVTTNNADFTIYQPFAGEPVNEIFLYFGNRTINGAFAMEPTISAAQKVRFMNSVTFTQSSNAAVGELIIASGANVRFE